MNHMDRVIHNNGGMKKDALRQIVARNLAAAMERRPGLDTQLALAKKAKMGQSHISRILNGSTAPTIDTLATLSEVLDIQPWELLSDDDTTRQAALERMLGGPVNPVANERVRQAYGSAPKVVHIKRRKP
jgi:ribosome-binding protein aMBF1 (putative translation factor)